MTTDSKPTLTTTATDDGAVVAGPRPVRSLDLSARPVPTLGGMNRVVFGIELRRIVRNRRTMIFVLVFPVVMFLFIASQITGPNDSMAPALANVGSYIMVDMAIYGAIMATTSAGATVSIERASGWSRQLRLTPLSPTAYVLMKVFSALVVGFLATAVTFVVGAVTGKARMPLQAWLATGVIIVVGSLIFAALGLFMGYLLPSENTMQFLGPILAVLAIFGGIFSAPVDPTSGFGRISSLTPIYGFAQIAHWPQTLTATGAHGQLLISWVVNVVVWAVVFVAGAVWRFRKDTARV